MKKRLLAAMLSLTMLFGQLMPVMAGDDADAAVSEEAVTEEETQDKETSPAGEVEDVDIEEAGYVALPAGVNVKTVLYNHIVGKPVKINNVDYNFNAYVSYYGKIQYLGKGKKVKPAEHLEAEVYVTNLDELVWDVTGQDAKGLIDWKFTGYKNTKIGNKAYFKAKAVINKDVKKALGLKGKPLKYIKKGISNINKAASKTKFYFEIVKEFPPENPVDPDEPVNPVDPVDPVDPDQPEIKEVKINSTTFPDSNFRAVVKADFDRDKNNFLDKDEIIYARNLWCVNKGIKSLKGIEYLVELRGIYCMDNQIKSWDLSKNTLLTGIWCSGNKFTSLDFTVNPNLEWVYCFDCNLTSLNVANNPKMSYIECNTNPLTTLDVSHNPLLEHLTCGSCELTTLDLSRNPNLQHLDAFRNHFKTLDLSHNPKMKRLDIWDNPGLGSIDVSMLEGLQYYNCSHNDVTSIDVSNNHELTKLICSYNRELTELDVSNNPKLVYLDCAYCSIDSLDISNNPYLYFLQAFINEFDELDIGYCPFLVKTFNEGEKKAENPDVTGAAHSWTIDYGGDTSTGKDNIFFLCVGDEVDLLTEEHPGALPDLDPYPYSELDPGVSEADLVKREEVVQKLYEMAGKPSVSGLKSRFNDVKGSEYEAAILWGEKVSMCMGFPYVASDEFGMGKWITRQDLVFMLMRYSEFKGYKRDIDFGRSDEYIDYFDIDYYAWEAVCWAATWHIMEGKGAEGAPKSEQRIDPHGRVTYAEMDAIIDNMLRENGVK